MKYIGTYHDQDYNVRLDLNSMSSKLYVTINRLYEDMMTAKIVDGANIAQPSDRQLDELNQSECDVITLNDEDIDGLKELFGDN